MLVIPLNCASGTVPLLSCDAFNPVIALPFNAGALLTTKLPTEIPAAEKPPPASRLTMVPGVLVLVAVSPSDTAPPSVVAVMSELPVTERTPKLLKVVEPPKVTTPPPPKPVPGNRVNALFASCPLLTVPLNCPAARVPERLLAVLAKIA